MACVEEAARQGAGLVVFGEALLPGYPVWLSRADGARFESRSKKSCSPSTRSKRSTSLWGTWIHCSGRRDAWASRSCSGSSSALEIVRGTRCTARQRTCRRAVSCAPCTASWSRPTRSAWCGGTGTARVWRSTTAGPSAPACSTAGRTGCRWRGPRCRTREWTSTSRSGPVPSETPRASRGTWRGKDAATRCRCRGSCAGVTFRAACPGARFGCPTRTRCCATGGASWWGPTVASCSSRWWGVRP